MSEDHHHPRDVSPIEARVLAIEDLLVEKGYVRREDLDEFIRLYEEDIGPLNGAKVVARAWTDPDYKARLLENGTAAIAELGFGGAEGDYMIVKESTDDVHHVVVCTLCSCYPWPVLGLPPDWYKDAPYRSRVVREPRRLLAEMGCEVPEGTEIEVWDSSADARYLVIPQRPAGTEDRSEEELAALVTRDAMIGVARL